MNIKILLICCLIIFSKPTRAQYSDTDTLVVGEEQSMSLQLLNQIFPSSINTSSIKQNQKELIEIVTQNTGGCMAALQLDVLDSTSTQYIYKRLEELAFLLYRAGTPLIFINGYNANQEAVRLNKIENIYGIVYYGNSSCRIEEKKILGYDIFNKTTYKLTGYKKK